jgi:WD40 repeat protein
MPVRAVAFSGDGKYMAAAGDDLLVHVFSVTDWSEVYTFSGHTGSVLCLDFSPDSRYLASGSGTDKVIPQNAGENVTRIWDLTTGKESLVLRGHRDGVLAVEWSNDGSRIATVSDDRTVRVWSFPAGGLLVNVTGHTSGVLDVDWSPDQSRLITGSRDYKIKLWNSTTGEQLATWPDYNCVRSVDYHPDGTLAATSGVDLTLKLRDSGSGTALKVVKDGVEQHAMVMCSRWSPDGLYLASALGKSHTVIVYAFGGGSGGGDGIDMTPITLSLMAMVFIAFTVYLSYSALRDIRRRRP